MHYPLATAFLSESRNKGLGDHHARAVIQFCALLLSCSWLAGCALVPKCTTAPELEPRVANVFSYGSVLSPEIRRVAVLPLACDHNQPELRDACENMTRILQNELTRTGKFETCIISPGLLQLCTGRSTWTDSEILPENLFEVLRNNSGCDAVLFAQLTAFRAYEPLRVGWRLRLVNARTAQTFWAFDEVFEVCPLPMSAGLRWYDWKYWVHPGETAEQWVVKNSPRLFAQHTAAQAFETLPKR